MHTLSFIPIRLPASFPDEAPLTEHHRTMAFSGSSYRLGRLPGLRSWYVETGGALGI